MNIEVTSLKTRNYWEAISNQSDGFHLPSFSELENVVKYARYSVPEQKELICSDLIEGTDLVKGLVYYTYRVLMIVYTIK